MNKEKAQKIFLVAVGVLLAIGGGAFLLRSAFGQDPEASSMAVGVAVVISGLVLISPQHSNMVIAQLERAWRAVKGLPREDSDAEKDVEQISQIVKQHTDVIGSQKPAPPPDEWYNNLRPVLHQASMYSVPTYYLDQNYHIVDWNIAFEFVFSAITSCLRGKHVNWFIARLANQDEVFSHAREFSGRSIPLVDTEPIVYESEAYGTVRFIKVASQLHDERGTCRGWAVALILREIAWGKFEKDMRDKLTQDKIWSVYASSYDKVLREFPDYHRLIEKVISVVNGTQSSVLDLGAGTGNVTEKLMERGHNVTVVENNMAMLDHFRAKAFESNRIKVVKTSVEHLDVLSTGSFDAAVMVNLLYAVDDPLSCLREVHRVLRPDGVIGFSTTHSGTKLKPLLESIKRTLKEKRLYRRLADDYARVEQANGQLELMACRYSQQQYSDWVRHAGFEIIAEYPSEYVGAVMVVHARKM